MINAAQKRGLRTQIYLIILIIPIVAFLIDRILFAIQKGLFPHKYGGNGWLLVLVRDIAHRISDVKSMFFKPTPPYDRLTIENASTLGASPTAAIDRSGNE